MANSTHRKIIELITEKWSNGEAFAIWEIVKLTGVSTSSVVRTLNKLVDLKLVNHSTRNSYMGRHYRVLPRWTTAKDVIENFELAKMLHI